MNIRDSLSEKFSHGAKKLDFLKKLKKLNKGYRMERLVSIPEFADWYKEKKERLSVLNLRANLDTDPTVREEYRHRWCELKDLLLDIETAIKGKTELLQNPDEEFEEMLKITREADKIRAEVARQMKGDAQ